MARADRLFATCGLVLAPALQAADALIANVALPRIENDLGGGVAFGAWVITGYLCATAVMAPLTGWLRRRYGARRLFRGAIGLFIVASLMCGLAPSAWALILFRILQGAGGGVIHPLAQAILLDLYPKERHGRIIAIFGAGIMVGPILGPPIGGIITDFASWRWVFMINLPLGLFSIACVWRLRSAVETTRDLSLDIGGILLLMTGVGVLQLFLQQGVEQSWLHSPEPVVEAAIIVGAFAMLVRRARQGGFRAFRPDVFKDINFVTAAFYNLMLSALLFVSVVFVPLLAEGPLGFDASIAGALIVPRAILLMIVMLGVGPLVGRIDHRVLLMVGWLLMAIGLLILSLVEPAESFVWIITGSVIQSIGAGLLYIPLATLAFSTLASGLRTDATGLYSLLRQLGYASGVALMTAVLQMKIGMHLAHPLPSLAAGIGMAETSVATLGAYSDCFRMMAIASVVIVPGIFLFRTSRSGPD
jgi:DHA2 family multidrug resistance protein